MGKASSYVFRPEERPNVPGSPQVPSHPPARRAGYVGVALLMALTATFGNALVNVNVANLAGTGGMYVEQASWLPAIYVAVSACANLLLVKARSQFGLNTVSYALLGAYIVAALLQFVFPAFASAILIRAISGMLGAGLTTVTVYNLLQVFPAKVRPAALLIGVTLPQFSTPLARLVPIEMLAFSGWQGLHAIELGLGLSALASAVLLPLPPGERADVFEPVDFLTIGLLLPAMVLFCGVLNEGRLLWWFDTPWLGWALAVAIVLAAGAVLVEAVRSRPLLQLRWLSSLDMLRFALIAMLMRLALAEQTYGAVGLLTASGLTNDQFHILFGLVALAMLCGMITAVATARPRTLPYQVLAAALVIALGAWLDTGGNSLTRPAQLYWSQSLIAFGTTLFFGPTMIYGFLKIMERGPDHLISLVVVFSITQNVGGLLGSAALGTYQIAASRAHMQALAERVVGGDPMVVRRIADGSASLGGVLVDPAARAAQGGVLLAQAMGREASVLAFNDVFRVVYLLALATALYVACAIGLHKIKRRLVGARPIP